MNIPALHGNWVDLAIIIIILVYLASGWGRGFVLGILDLVGFLLSFVGALKFYSIVGAFLIANFSLSRGIANALGFLLSGIMTELIYSLLTRVLLENFYPKFLQTNKNRDRLNLVFRLDKALGFIPALGEALVFTAFILTLLVTLPIAGRIKKDIIQAKIGGSLVSRTQGIERQLNGIFGEAVNETLTFLTINANPQSSERVDLGFAQKEGKVDIQAEESMFTLVNIERSKMGLKILTNSPKLRDLSRNYSKDMFDRGYFSHFNPENESPFDRMKKADISFLAAGENLALAPNVALAHQGLMNSPGHKANILSVDFGQVGIGVIDGGIYGEMFVQEFTD